MPRSSRARWVAGQPQAPALRGVPGSRRYGCHPKATGTARRPVGTSVVSTVSCRSRRRCVTSMRCGNGNAGLSTSIERGPRGPSGASRAALDPPARRPTSRPVDRQAVAVGAQRQPVQVDVDAGARYRREPRLAHGASSGRPSVAPAAAPRAHPAARGARGRGTAARRRSSRDPGGTWPTTRRRRRASPARPGTDALHRRRRQRHGPLLCGGGAVSGLVTVSSDLPSALIPISRSTTPPRIMIPAPTR